MDELILFFLSWESFSVQSSLRTSSPIREGSEPREDAASPFACGSRVTCRVSPNMESLLVARLSQSPSFLFSGSGSWPQREGLLSLSFAFAAENIKILPLALCAREKISARLVGKSRS